MRTRTMTFMAEHHSGIAVSQALAAGLLGVTLLSGILLVAFWRRPKAALWLGVSLTVVQGIHAFEHILQLRQWFAAPWQAGWMSPFAHNLSVGLASLADRVGLTGTALGMELLHLVGNVLFAVGVAALWRGGLRGLAGVLAVFEGVHLLEHVTLTVSTAMGRPAWGASTFFSQLSGAELSSYRVWWHLVMNLVAFGLAVAVIARAGKTDRISALWAVATGIVLAVLPVAFASTTPGEPGYSQLRNLVLTPTGLVALVLTPVGCAAVCYLLTRVGPWSLSPAKGLAAAGAVALAVTIGMSLASPPKAYTAQEPAGWPSGMPLSTLDGSVAALSRAAWNGMLTLPVTARIGAWSAEAYDRAWQAEGGSREAAVVAFGEVAATLAVNPGLGRTLRQPGSSIQGGAREVGEQIAQQVLAEAAEDGYSQAGADAPKVSTPPEWKWAGRLHGTVHGEEPQWGTLTTMAVADGECKVKAPSYLTQDPEGYISNQRELAQRYTRDPAVMAIVSHWVAQEGVVRSEPWQAWVRTAQDNLPSSDPDARDRALLDILRDVHSAVVTVWGGKWEWQVTSFADRASSTDIEDRLVVVVPLTPAYPDEVSAVGAVVSEHLKKAGAGTIRTEMPGRLTAAPRTRVLPDVQAVLDEVSAALVGTGVRTQEDVNEGIRVGRCIAGDLR